MLRLSSAASSGSVHADDRGEGRHQVGRQTSSSLHRSRGDLARPSGQERDAWPPSQASRFAPRSVPML